MAESGEDSFEFEDERGTNQEVPNSECYDLELALAISLSVQAVPGSQLRMPEEVQEIFRQNVGKIMTGGGTTGLDGAEKNHELREGGPGG